MKSQMVTRDWEICTILTEIQGGKNMAAEWYIRVWENWLRGFALLHSLQNGFGSMQLPIQWALLCLFPKGKRPGRETGLLHHLGSRLRMSGLRSHIWLHDVDRANCALQENKNFSLRYVFAWLYNVTKYLSKMFTWVSYKIIITCPKEWLGYVVKHYTTISSADRCIEIKATGSSTLRTLQTVGLFTKHSCTMYSFSLSMWLRQEN